MEHVENEEICSKPYLHHRIDPGRIGMTWFLQRIWLVQS